VTNLWNSARERELTKLYNAELRARHDGTATVRHCQLTIIFWQHLTCSPGGAPPATPLLSDLAHRAQTEHPASRERQAPHGRP
jgi:hypothetical protein